MNCRILVTTLYLLFVLLPLGNAYSSPTGVNSSFANATAKYNYRPLMFLENKGQVTNQDHLPRPDIQFSIAAAPGLNIFIGPGAIHYQFSHCVTPKTSSGGQQPIALPAHKKPGANIVTQPIDLYRMDVELVGANLNAKMITAEKQDYHENHYTGAKTLAVNGYNRIIYKDIYPNIDWVLYTSNGQLKHEFEVHEGGRVADIQLKYGGATNMKLNTDGSLTCTTPMGTITEQAPETYQQDGRKISSYFKLEGNTLTYNTGSYTGTLVIDPAIEWATYYGGSGVDEGYEVKTDHAGHVYLAGLTNSTAGIATTGAYQAVLPGSQDAFVVKFTSAGTRLWASYFGGSGHEGECSIAADSSGNLYVTGGTSDTGIATPGAYQATYGGGAADGYLIKLDATGALLWATYFGGSGSDRSCGVTTDTAGNVYIAGGTTSTSGIATPGAFQTTCDDTDAFLAKFTGAGSLLWATYFGGMGYDIAISVAADTAGYVYIGGNTTSDSGIATPGAYQTAFSGTLNDAFLASFNTSGSLQWATYYGGSAQNSFYGLSLDGMGQIYIVGFTNSITGIATPGAFKDSLDGIFDDFLAKFNSSGVIQWATYYGGPGVEEVPSVTNDNKGNVYLADATSSTTGIATLTAFQPVFAGGTWDAFLAKFDSSGARLYATYYGGAGDDEADGIATDDSNNVYLGGVTTSSMSIATPGAYQISYGGSYDAFLAKINFCTIPNAGIISGLDSVCVDSFITITDSIGGGLWASTDTSVATISGGIVTGKTTGLDTIVYTVSGDPTCGTATVEKVVSITNECDMAAVNAVPVPYLAVYPNPVQNTLTIASSSPIGSVVMYNLVGQAIYSNEYKSSRTELPVDGLPPGVYFLKINGISVKQFVKE